MPISASTLRSNIYKLLDDVIEKGNPLHVERKGVLIEIAVVEKSNKKLDKLSKHNCIVGDPEDLVHIDWSGEWNGNLP